MAEKKSTNSLSKENAEASVKKAAKRIRRTPRKKVPPDAMKRIGNRWEQLREFLINKGLEPTLVTLDPNRDRVEIMCNVKLDKTEESRIGLCITIKMCELNQGLMVPMGMPMPMGHAVVHDV